MLCLQVSQTVANTVDLSLDDAPDPDKMYSVTDAAPYTSSPLVEVFDHNVGVIHRRIAKRQQDAVARLTARQKARQEISGSPVQATNVYTTPVAKTVASPLDVTPTIDPITCPLPPLAPFEFQTCSQLNASLHRRDFARRINRQPGSDKLDLPPCVQRSCPFCRGPLLL